MQFGQSIEVNAKKEKNISFCSVVCFFVVAGFVLILLLVLVGSIVYSIIFRCSLFCFVLLVYFGSISFCFVFFGLVWFGCFWFVLVVISLFCFLFVLGGGVFWLVLLFCFGFWLVLVVCLILFGFVSIFFWNANFMDDRPSTLRGHLIKKTQHGTVFLRVLSTRGGGDHKNAFWGKDSEVWSFVRIVRHFNVFQSLAWAVGDVIFVVVVDVGSTCSFCKFLLKNLHPRHTNSHRAFKKKSLQTLGLGEFELFKRDNIF